ncbi:TATA box-binding protein-associated factor RNA polymerase I subunit C [Desmophyllum pertusum]|uniref:TATA box-binding protein-associated factor RNA polymerase I subunit C n=1 Tax=Desmophyllum pertusum TaxID=174260 RepID=A0A9W9YAC1_9CNID|nr:TATA box-binding protein-associated factor RNA polymerase I subunit C [Desmophyllum pertusum]
MAARKHAFFQGYNFPFCGEENVSQSFIDYGSPSILNIDLDKKDQKVVIHSRQTHDSHILQRLVANQLSLPYMEPNERSSTIPEETPSGFRFIHGDNGKPYRCKRAEFERSNPGGLSRNRLSSEKYNLHVENFSEDHRDVMYSTIAELVQDEFNCYPWNTCNMFKSNSFLPWQRKELGCKLCSKTNHQGLLVYPSGPGLDVLNFSHISQCSDVVDFENTCTENSVSSLKPVLSNQQFAISGRIRQIDFSSYSPNNMIIGIRSQYHCSFFQSIPGGSTEGQETVHVSKGGTLDLK